MTYIYIILNNNVILFLEKLSYVITVNDNTQIQGYKENIVEVGIWLLDFTRLKLHWKSKFWPESRQHNIEPNQKCGMS